MMMDRRHQEHAFSGAFEIEHLNDDRERFDHKQPANNGQNDLVFRGHGNRPQSAAQGQRSGIAHEHSRRRGIEPQKAEPSANKCSRKDEDFPRARHIMQTQIVGEVHTSHDIGNRAQRARRDHHRHDRQPVETVCQVHRIGRADNDDHGEGNKEPPQIDQQILEHRQRQLELQLGRMHHRGPDRSDQGNHETQKQAHAAGHTLGIGFRDLGIVIRKPDQPVAESHEHHDPDIGIVEPRPEQGRDQQGGQDQQPAHRRRACLGEMGLGAVVTDRLALTLTPAQHVDQRTSEEHRENQSREKRAARTHGDIAKQVEKIAPIRQARNPI